MQVDEHIEHILHTHFDAKWGAPYWLEKKDRLGFDPIGDIRTPGDLSRFPPFPRHDLATRPLEDFIPKKFHGRLDEFITCETGGTTGPPARTAFRRDEFDAAFVTPFLNAAALTGFPRDEHWLFIGPSGPHPIGKAARACAAAMGSMDPFAVDFDPRWARTLSPGSFARQRYLEHVLHQAQAILSTQHVGVLFATPPVLAALGQRLGEKVRARIRGLHLGGMAADREFWRRLSDEWFPRAAVLSGYGNSLAGMCPQLEHAPRKPPEYFPHGCRLVLEVDEPEEGTRGRLRFHRLDESCFLPNVLERDEAEPVSPPAHVAGEGFTLPGLRDPRPPSASQDQSEGLY